LELIQASLLEKTVYSERKIKGRAALTIKVLCFGFFSFVIFGLLSEAVRLTTVGS
jgi:hypothetical protein